MVDVLKQMDYPGRIIIVGRDETGANVVINALTGRSESSKARRFKSSADRKFVFTDVTDSEALNNGDPALLVYNAIAVESDTLVISNGAQTDLIRATLSGYRKLNGVEMPLHLVLPTAFSEPYLMAVRDGRTIDLANYEPDSPIFTPRISGVVRGDDAMLSIVKKGENGKALKSFHSFKLEAGKGKLISTYNGPNPESGPVPVFDGEPRDVLMQGNTNEIVSKVYENLGQFKISVTGMVNHGNYVNVVIKNLHGDE